VILVTGFWPLAAGGWLLVTGYGSLAAGLSNRRAGVKPAPTQKCLIDFVGAGFIPARESCQKAGDQEQEARSQWPEAK
jgi:hypothetical protein